MTSYHINRNTGRPNMCEATKKACPVGGDHFPTKEAAMNEIQRAAAAENETLVSMKKTPTRSSAAGPKKMSRETLFTTFMKIDASQITPDELEAKITSDLEEYADYEYPGCGGCDGSGSDYCRCKSFTRDLSIDSKELAASFYRRYSNIQKYRSFDNLMNEEKTLVYEIEDMFRHHGIIDNFGYDVEVSRGYYGEELDRVTCRSSRRFEELHNDLAEIFDKKND